MEGEGSNEATFGAAPLPAAPAGSVPTPLGRLRAPCRLLHVPMGPHRRLQASESASDAQVVQWSRPLWSPLAGNSDQIRAAGLPSDRCPAPAAPPGLRTAVLTPPLPDAMGRPAGKADKTDKADEQPQTSVSLQDDGKVPGAMALLQRQFGGAASGGPAAPQAAWWPPAGSDGAWTACRHCSRPQPPLLAAAARLPLVPLPVDRRRPPLRLLQTTATARRWASST